MRDLLSDYERLVASDQPVGRAVVTSVWGSAPRPEGSSMLATAEGVMAGSVSGGCVEAATATEIGEAIGCPAVGIVPRSMAVADRASEPEVALLRGQPRMRQDGRKRLGTAEIVPERRPR